MSADLAKVIQAILNVVGVKYRIGVVLIGPEGEDGASPVSFGCSPTLTPEQAANAFLVEGHFTMRKFDRVN